MELVEWLIERCLVKGGVGGRGGGEQVVSVYDGGKRK